VKKGEEGKKQDKNITSPSVTQGGHKKKKDRNHRAKIHWPALFCGAAVTKIAEFRLPLS